MDCLIVCCVSKVSKTFFTICRNAQEIEQSFSKTSQYLKINDGVTTYELYHKLREKFENKEIVYFITYVTRWSGLLKQEHI